MFDLWKNLTTLPASIFLQYLYKNYAFEPSHEKRDFSIVQF